VPGDEASLRRSDARLRAVLNAAFDAIVTMDAEGIILGVNPAAEAMFGRSESELVGKELAAAIIPPSLREAHRRGVRSYMATGARRISDHPVELMGMRADGSEFPVEVAIRRLELDGPPVFTGFIRDSSARRAAEEEVRLLAQEQAALRRVATLVARGADQATVVAAVTSEVAGLFDAETANLIRYTDEDRRSSAPGSRCGSTTTSRARGGWRRRCRSSTSPPRSARPWCSTEGCGAR
jgi:PAS domain S-box-containing protein